MVEPCKEREVGDLRVEELSDRQVDLLLERILPAAMTDQPSGLGKGGVPVPDGPRLGVTYDWDFIDRNKTARHSFFL